MNKQLVLTALLSFGLGFGVAVVVNVGWPSGTGRIFCPDCPTPPRPPTPAPCPVPIPTDREPRLPGPEPGPEVPK